MSAAGSAFLIGSFVAFLAERMFDANAAVRWPLHLVAAVLLVMAAAGAARKLGRHPRGATAALVFFGVALLAGPIYVLQQKDTLDSFGLTGEETTRARTALQALLPLVWAIGALPFLSIDRTLSASPHSVHPLRFKAALESGLALAFGLGMLFPLNWLAKEYNVRKDYGFFKVTEVGSSTRSVVDSLGEPVRAVLFFPASSEVLQEIRPYFDDLDGDNFAVEVLDQALEPETAKEWKVRDNGNIALIKGSGEDEQVEIIKLTDKLDTARKDLKKLDSKVQTALLKLARDKKTAYFTVGHEELYWKNATDPMENIESLKKGIEGLNFKVKELGVDDGLAQAIPEDAAVVFIVGPRRAFLPEEVTALREYRDRGGAIFMMLEPGDEVDQALAAVAGVSYYGYPLLSDKYFVRMKGGPSDQALVGTAKFSSHESMTTLTKNASQLTLIVPTVGGIKELPEHPGKVTITVKGSTEWWADLNGNYGFDKDAEKRGGWEVGAVASGPAADGNEWRIAVVGDSTWASNLVLTQSQANQIYLSETLGWLTKDPALQGETETEEDVKIQHTKEGEAAWFYGTTALVPALVFLGGWFRVSRRRAKGVA